MFRNGLGNFERGGERFKHVLDGDGLISRFSIDGSTGRARFASKFVEARALEEEAEADSRCSIATRLARSQTAVG